MLTGALLGLALLSLSPPSIAATSHASDRTEKSPLVWPVEGKVTSRFGPRGFFHVQHRGVDIKAPKGTPVRAAAAGTVAFSGRQSSYGRVIKIDHPGGLRTIYAHNSTNFVKAGQRVKAGTIIAAVGQTGRASTNHLHFEVRRHDVARDPLPLLRSAPRTLQVKQREGTPPPPTRRKLTQRQARGTEAPLTGAVSGSHLVASAR